MPHLHQRHQATFCSPLWTCLLLRLLEQVVARALALSSLPQPCSFRAIDAPSAQLIHFGSLGEGLILPPTPLGSSCRRLALSTSALVPDESGVDVDELGEEGLDL